jgi:hypothetical protein
MESAGSRGRKKGKWARPHGTRGHIADNVSMAKDNRHKVDGTGIANKVLNHATRCGILPTDCWWINARSNVGSDSESGNMPTDRRIHEIVDSVFDEMSTERGVEEIVEELAQLQVQQDALIAELRELTTNNTRATRQTGAGQPFALGDRIRISNPKAGAGQRFVAGDHVGTVTQVTSTRVYFDTDSGQKSRYRAFKNVKKLNAEPSSDRE